MSKIVENRRNGPVAKEQAYLAHQSREHKKKYAQFFTPEAASNIMASWVTAHNPENILDPAYGTGRLGRAVAKMSPTSKITAYEIDKEVAEVGRAISSDLGLNLNLRVEDFLDSGMVQYEAIIANPPYLKHHDFPSLKRHVKRINDLYDFPLSGTSNAYVVFMVECLFRLTEGGRAAFIVPTEWMNSNFGKPVRDFFLKSKLLKGIVHVSSSVNIFDDALTTASILLFEKTDDEGFINVVTSHDISGYDSYSDVFSLEKKQRINRSDLANHEKWENFMFSGNKETPQGFVSLGEMATTKRGIATGANSFFLISKSEAEKKGIRMNRTLPCIGKSSLVKNLDFRKSDQHDLHDQEAKICLINFSDNLSQSEAEYVGAGEELGLHERYLNKKRKPWYGLEKTTPAPIWASVFGRDKMRFILNSAGFLNLTTFHGVYPTSLREHFAGALTACLNSGLVQELIKHDIRSYGGGLKKFEPKDLLEISVPDIRNANPDILKQMASLISYKRVSSFSSEDEDIIKRLVDMTVRDNIPEKRRV